MPMSIMQRKFYKLHVLGMKVYRNKGNFLKRRPMLLKDPNVTANAIAWRNWSM
jgi:hypothetical protein